MSREKVHELRARGMSVREMAEQLGFTPNTIVYHLQRPTDAASEPRHSAQPSNTDLAVRRSETREKVRALLASGLTRAEVARHLGLSKGTVTYHARRLGETIADQCARRYDWEAVQSYYDAGHSVRACMAAFGFSSQSWHEAVRRGAVMARPATTPLEDLLVAGTYRGRANLKARLIKERVKDARCERCGLTEWRGEAIGLALHHVNGDRFDNRLANLRLLCPNCHSQTDNFSGRNGRGRASRGT